MSEENTSVDEGELEAAKTSLQKVEEVKQGSTAKPIFTCVECGEEQDIPEDVLNKMENDEDISEDMPDHCGKTMKIGVAGASE